MRSVLIVATIPTPGFNEDKVKDVNVETDPVQTS